MQEDDVSYTEIEYDASSPKRELAALRDQLKLKVHLAKAELRSQWEELENKWTLLQSRLTVLEVAKQESKREISQATKDLIKELKDGYQRMRGALERV